MLLQYGIVFQMKVNPCYHFRLLKVSLSSKSSADKQKPHMGIIVKMSNSGQARNCSLTVSVICNENGVQVASFPNNLGFISSYDLEFSYLFIVIKSFLSFRDLMHLTRLGHVIM